MARSYVFLQSWQYTTHVSNPIGMNIIFLGCSAEKTEPLRGARWSTIYMQNNTSIPCMQPYTELHRSAPKEQQAKKYLKKKYRVRRNVGENNKQPYQ